MSSEIDWSLEATDQQPQSDDDDDGDYPTSDDDMVGLTMKR